jgi:hypothetical protein
VEQQKKRYFGRPRAGVLGSGIGGLKGEMEGWGLNFGEEFLSNSKWKESSAGS